MLRLKLFVIALLFVSFPFIKSEAQDSTDFDWEEDFEFNEYDNAGHPYLEFNMGAAALGLRGFDAEFATHSQLLAKLGFAYSDSLEKNIAKFKNNYFFVSNISTEYNFPSGGSTVNRVKLDSWQLGFASEKAYGYSGKSLSFIPYNGFGVKWGMLNFYYPVVQTFAAVNTEPLSRFERSVRFGVTNEAGIRVKIGKTIALNAAYRYDLFFPRYLIWKHFGSVLIEFTALEAIDKFVNEVMEASPVSAPVVNFVLKNALSYAFFSLQKEKMYWPFASESPLTTRTLQFGVTYVF